MIVSKYVVGYLMYRTEISSFVVSVTLWVFFVIFRFLLFMSAFHVNWSLLQLRTIRHLLKFPRRCKYLLLLTSGLFLPE